MDPNTQLTRGPRDPIKPDSRQRKHERSMESMMDGSDVANAGKCPIMHGVRPHETFRGRSNRDGGRTS
jgi:hypothetical protein